MHTDSFLFATDDTLLTEHSGISELFHNSNFSDNPQVTSIVLGSLHNLDGDPDRKLQAESNPGVDDIVITVVDRLPEWQADHVYTVGSHVQPTTPNGLRYEVTARTGDFKSHASTEPTWPTTPIGATVVDDAITWTLIGQKHETTEVSLALTEGDLDTATPGASLNLGHTIESTTANAVKIWIKVVNAVTTVGNDSVDPDIKLNIPALREYEI